MFFSCNLLGCLLVYTHLNSYETNQRSKSLFKLTLWCFFGSYWAIRNNIIVAKKTTELVLLFHKKTTKLVFIWFNMNQKRTRLLNFIIFYIYFRANNVFAAFASLTKNIFVLLKLICYNIPAEDALYN